MRLDHIAYRVAQGKRDEATRFFVEAFGYKQQGEPFEIYFDDEKKEKALCVALEPPEKIDLNGIVPFSVWTGRLVVDVEDSVKEGRDVEYHLAPEIFISEGSEGSIVDDWVKSRGGVGGIHHLAYQTDDVIAKMKEFQNNGWAEFSSNEPMKCEGIEQIFSKPNILGVVIEFIHRTGTVGFCKENVKALMQSTKGD